MPSSGEDVLGEQGEALRWFPYPWEGGNSSDKNVTSKVESRVPRTPSSSLLSSSSSLSSLTTTTTDAISSDHVDGESRQGRHRRVIRPRVYLTRDTWQGGSSPTLEDGGGGGGEGGGNYPCAGKDGGWVDEPPSDERPHGDGLSRNETAIARISDTRQSTAETLGSVVCAGVLHKFSRDDSDGAVRANDDVNPDRDGDENARVIKGGSAETEEKCDGVSVDVEGGGVRVVSSTSSSQVCRQPKKNRRVP